MALKNKLVVEKIIEEEGLYSAIKLFGGIDNVSKIVNKPIIQLTREFFENKIVSTNNSDVQTGGYDFNFMITDIDENDDIWNVYVKILDGQVTLIMTDDGETYDLWDSDLWQQDFWWEIQGEIEDIISNILKLYKPKEIDLEIHHNLR